MRTILITTPSISFHDAVSNDVWMQEKLFKALGWNVFVYAEHAPAAARKRLINLGQVETLLAQQDVIWLYHHSVYWILGEQLFTRARCRVFLRYHNITPPEFFDRYEETVAAYATRHGIAQTQYFVSSNRIERFIGASWFNCKELIGMGAKQGACVSVAPFHTLEDFESARMDQSVLDALDKEKINILFVGRVVPNKGHLHLLSVLDKYIDMYGTNVHLHILGNTSCAPKLYLKAIERFANERRLADFVSFWGSGSFDALFTMYKSASVFLVTSEHEGFCVPVIEAQYHRLPIVALNRTAVAETLGPNQIVIDDLDYRKFAAALHVAATDTSVRTYLQEEGYKNHQRFAIKALEQQLLNAITG